MLMPTLQSRICGARAGRYDDYGEEMLRIRDWHDRDMPLTGPRRGADHRHFPDLRGVLTGSFR